MVPHNWAQDISLVVKQQQKKRRWWRPWGSSKNKQIDQLLGKKKSWTYFHIPMKHPHLVENSGSVTRRAFLWVFRPPFFPPLLHRFETELISRHLSSFFEKLLEDFRFVSSPVSLVPKVLTHHSHFSLFSFFFFSFPSESGEGDISQ
ncbi:MAG: hypothetical protein Q8P67_13965 [archaeon]|nr:hypothetical protein [archaeon]